MIVEDEPLVAADLDKQLVKAGMEVCATFESGDEVLKFLKDHSIDVILMDIRLYGSLDGIDTAHQINRNYDIPIVFLTANTDASTFNRAKLSFPHSFLSKPFRITDVINSIELAHSRQIDEKKSESELTDFLPDRIFIRDKDTQYKVLFVQIIFIEAQGSYSKIHTAERSFTVSQTLKKVEPKLESAKFVRVHRSYVVNIEKVDRLSDGYVHIGDRAIPLSGSYKEEVLKRFQTL